MNPYSVGLLLDGRPRFVPSTAEAIVGSSSSTRSNSRGTNVIVIGRSTVVGHPAAALLLNEDATVTVAHKRTSDVPGSRDALPSSSWQSDALAS